MSNSNAATMETFVREALAEFRQSPGAAHTIGCWLLIIACSLASTYLIGKISSATDTAYWTMAVSLATVMYVTSRARRQIDRLDNEIARHVGDKLKVAHLKLYARLDRATKDKNPVGPYEQLSAGMRASTCQLISMIPNFFGEFVESVLSFALGIAMSSNHGGVIYALAATVCTATVVAARRINVVSAALLKVREAAETGARSANRIALQQFQIDAKVTVADVVAESSSANKAVDAHRLHRLEFATVIDRANAATTAAVLACGYGAADVARAMMVVGVLNMGIHWMRAVSESFTAVAHYQNFWAENAGGLDAHHAQHPLASLEVTSVDIRLGQGAFALKGGGFDIPPGSRVLIHGEYGSGKSTLLKALMGLLRGVALAAAGPENYTEAWVEVSQDLTAKLPWTDVTVSQLFRGAAPDAIAAAIAIAGASALLSEGRVDPQRKLTGTLSGGQKSAAAIATRLINLAPDGRHWFALDECTTGMDPRQSYATIARIFAAYRRSTMFVISHLERAETAFEWTHILDVRDGQVTLRVKVSDC